MTRYFLLRLSALIPTLLGALVLCFLLLQFLPGGPVESQIASWHRADSPLYSPLVNEEAKTRLKKYYGFHLPWYERFWDWTKKWSRFDLGVSYTDSRPVFQLIIEALPVSLSLGLGSLFITYCLGIPLGIWKGRYANSPTDRITSLLLLAAYAAPPFAIATLCIAVSPTTGLVSENFASLSFWQRVTDIMKHVAPPVLCYSLSHLALITFLMKHSLEEQLSEEYIVVARAKGLSVSQTLKRHAVRNALLPVATGIRDWFTYFFSGSLLIENIFDLHGIGRLSYFAIIQRDYPILLGIIWCLCLTHLLGNLWGDIILFKLDPRLQFEAPVVKTMFHQKLPRISQGENR